MLVLMNRKTPKEERIIQGIIPLCHATGRLPGQEHTKSLRCVRAKRTSQLKAGHEDTLAHLRRALRQHRPALPPFCRESQKQKFPFATGRHLRGATSVQSTERGNREDLDEPWCKAGWQKARVHCFNTFNGQRETDQRGEQSGMHLD